MFHDRCSPWKAQAIDFSAARSCGPGLVDGVDSDATTSENWTSELKSCFAEEAVMVRSVIMTEILAGYDLPLGGVHGIAHWGRVLEAGLRLAEITRADKVVVAHFAVFHDARRRCDGDDPEHGKRGAELALRLRPGLAMTERQCALLVHACRFHAEGRTHDDPTVQTCWDADRLDLWRVGITPREPGLGATAARCVDILEWSRARSLADVVPDGAAPWLRLKSSWNEA